MSYQSNKTSASFTVQTASLSITVSPASGGPSNYWLPGEQLKVTVSDSISEVVDIFINLVQGSTTYVSNVFLGSVTSNAGSTASTTISIPWQLSSSTATYSVPGNMVQIYAVGESTGVKSNSVNNSVLFPTKITLSVSPNPVYIGQTITFSGTLQFEYPANTWNPLANQNVSLQVTNNTTSTVIVNKTLTTSSNGSFSYSTSTSSWSPGSYQALAAFGVSTLGLGIPSLQYAPSQVVLDFLFGSQTNNTLNMLKYAAIAAGVAIAGYAGYKVYEKSKNK
jgi:hypothetical protein